MRKKMSLKKILQPRQSSKAKVSDNYAALQMMSKVEVATEDPSTGPAYQRGAVLRGADFEFSESSSESEGMTESVHETVHGSSAAGDKHGVDADAFGAKEMLEPTAGLGGLGRTKKGKAILQTPDSGTSELRSDDMG